MVAVTKLKWLYEDGEKVSGYKISNFTNNACSHCLQFISI